jgi:hypothetical protein
MFYAKYGDWPPAMEGSYLVHYNDSSMTMSADLQAAVLSKYMRTTLYSDSASNELTLDSAAPNLRSLVSAQGTSDDVYVYLLYGSRTDIRAKTLTRGVWDKLCERGARDGLYGGAVGSNRHVGVPIPPPLAGQKNAYNTTALAVGIRVGSVRFR